MIPPPPPLVPHKLTVTEGTRLLAALQTERAYQLSLALDEKRIDKRDRDLSLELVRVVDGKISKLLRLLYPLIP